MVSNTPKVQWKFPLRNVFYMRLEIFMIVVLTALVFYLSFAITSGWFRVLYAFLFLVIYIIIANLMQLIRKVQDSYSITPQGMNIQRKTRFATTKVKIPLRDITGHKLDKIFLGGYLFTKDGAHMLYFNTKKELESFEQLLKKYVKNKRHK